MIILEGITIDELLEKIESFLARNLEQQLVKLVSEMAQKDKYLTRKEVAKLLRISLPTLNDWTKLGIIKSYRIGNRVLYKEREVDESLISVKYKRFN